jgi:heme/copper-type cytochrome/quinol oxidase subunit 3
MKRVVELRDPGAGAVDVSRLPTFQFGTRNIVWWGTLAFMATEGAIFVALAASYLYLWTRHLDWPPGVEPPDLGYGTLTTVLFLASLVPGHFAKHAAEHQELRGVRVWLVASVVLAVAILAVRAGEFTALNCRWDINAYGSMIWLLLGFHTFHLLTDFGDTVVLAVLMFTGPVDSARFGDVADNSLYWYFVVLAWLPLYALIYWAPRVL